MRSHTGRIAQAKGITRTLACPEVRLRVCSFQAKILLQLWRRIRWCRICLQKTWQRQQCMSREVYECCTL